MKRLILALAVGLSVLGLTGIASAHPPRYCAPVRVYRPVCPPIIVQPPCETVVAPCTPVIAPCETIIRPVYHPIYRGHHCR
jgi:hypothetical protein